MSSPLSGCVLFFTVFGLWAEARPEAGYQYAPPPPGPPSGSYGGPPIIPSGSYGGPPPNTGIGGNIFGGFSHTGIGGGAYITGGGGSSGIPIPPSIIQKHIYVHVPPPEPQEYRPQRPIHIPSAQKHYKIIFIKAPSPPVPTAPVIPIPPQNEEKTLVYVLVKKPDEQPEIQIPTAAPTQPSKPEVYFIRYKSQKDIGAGINIGAGISGAGVGISGAAGGLIGGIGGGIGGGIETPIGPSSIGGGGISTNYGPPGHSGPY